MIYKSILMLIATFRCYLEQLLPITVFCYLYFYVPTLVAMHKKWYHHYAQAVNVFHYRVSIKYCILLHCCFCEATVMDVSSGEKQLPKPYPLVWHSNCHHSNITGNQLLLSNCIHQWESFKMGFVNFDVGTLLGGAKMHMEDKRCRQVIGQLSVMCNYEYQMGRHRSLHVKRKDHGIFLRHCCVRRN